MIPSGIYAALQAVEYGLVAFPKAWALIQAAQEAGRDLTDDELYLLDIKRDTTHNEFLDAMRRKRAREAANQG